MFAIKIPHKAKLICSVIVNDEKLFRDVISILYRKFGNIDYISKIYKFDWTSYYNSEMGDGLLRRFVGFRDLFDRNELPEIKLTTNNVEEKWSFRDTSSDNNLISTKLNKQNKLKRTINLDPGFITAENLILASTKNFTHRIYLDHGIFADLTLVFSQGRFNSNPWTYSDYMDPDVLRIFNSIRLRYLKQLKI